MQKKYKKDPHEINGRSSASRKEPETREPRPTLFNDGTHTSSMIENLNNL